MSRGYARIGGDGGGDGGQTNGSRWETVASIGVVSVLAAVTIAVAADEDVRTAIFVDFLLWTKQNPGMGSVITILLFIPTSLIFLPFDVLLSVAAGEPPSTRLPTTLASAGQRRAGVSTAPPHHRTDITTSLHLQGYMFGMPGAIVSWLGYCIGSLCGFLVARYCIGTWLHRRFEDQVVFRALDSLVEEKGFRLTFLLQISPIMPCKPSTAAPAPTRYRCCPRRRRRRRHRRASGPARCRCRHLHSKRMFQLPLTYFGLEALNSILVPSTTVPPT